MKKLLVITIILLAPFATQANENSSVQTANNQRFQECIAASLHTMLGSELNSIVESKRTLKQTTLIPEGWTVVGVTAKKETGSTTPYLVICH